MMRRGRYSGSKRRQFRCTRCGATPPWQAVEQHRRHCRENPSTKRHRKD